MSEPGGHGKPTFKELISKDGRNKKAVFCVHCPCLILNPGDGVYTESEFPLPHMTRPTSSETVLEDTLADYWKVTDIYTFQNVGFSKSVGSNKFLICAECDMGPIGWFDTSTNESFVALQRVKHGDKVKR